MQCSTEVQVACELTLCSPRRRVFVKKEEIERTDGGLAVIQLSVSLHFILFLVILNFPSLPSHRFHPTIPHCSYPLPFPISPFSPLHCLPALHPARYTSPSLPHQYFILPLPSPTLHLLLSLRQIWAASWRPSDPRLCPRARAPRCTRPGYTASPGRRSLGSGTAARFPPAAACECASRFVLREVGCRSVLSLRGKVYFIFQYSFVFFFKVSFSLSRCSESAMLDLLPLRPSPPTQSRQRGLRRNFLVAVPPCSSLNLLLPIKRVIISALLTLQAG